ncbi:MAG: tetratricopeptide repeat protein [Gammaproteobacteria bacterium]|nr:tetratricopeptide repeat protein [Gammaproteobacteria bacterium]MXW46145.1 tetratricopeptide repeat protein [Gammaproteobacteria bacterium]MYD03319.1 tetratricopeptide repeat protein [Gammaproteobacteria bacterium]MYI26400.1 tetratricopeptide repeat protein [Gammaproteobacteria bacterium]
MKARLNMIFAGLVGVALLAPAGLAQAQEGEEEEQQTRRSEAMSERVHRRFSRAQEALELEDYATAEALLQEITELRGLTPYERAQTNNFYGFIHIEKEDYPSAIRSFLAVIEIGGPGEIPEGLYNQTIRTLSQLYMQVENYPQAVVFARRWIESQASPVPKDYMLLAMAYFQMEDWRNALENVQIAIERATQTGMGVEENWWRYLLAAHWELEEFPEALEVSKTLLTNWPKKQYWMQLQGLYSIVEDEANQFAAFWSCYDQGLLDRSNELVTMAQLFMLAEVPYKAAVVLQEGLDSGEIEETAVNYRYLAQAWQLAREDRKALDPLRKAAESEEDVEDKGDLYMRLAETYNALGDYDDCASAARQALRAGELKSEGRAYMLLGQCLFEQEQFDEAGDAFTRAARDSDTRRTATQWQNYLRREVKRRSDLEARLAQYGA